MDVTIEGTLTPSVLLKRGERRRVQMTPRIQRLVDKGFVKVITAHDNGAQVGAATDQPRTQVEVIEDEDDNGPGLYDGEEPDESEENGPDYPPPGNASREKWAAFLTEFGVPYPDGGEDDNGDPIPVATRDDLRVIWQQASGGS